MLPALTIFLGAFLVFLVQPLVGNTLLPVFGGTATVWSLCLASFQILLVGGYFYAHCVGRVEGRGKREEGRGGGRGLWVHVGVLLLAMGGLLAVVTGGAAVAGRHALPVRLGAVAVAYVVLSANSSLVQLLSGGKYKLYAVSNLGSLMGLVAYPFVFEYFLPLSVQWVVFAALGLGYALLFAVMAVRVVGTGRTSETSRTSGTEYEGLRTGDVRRETGAAGEYFALSFVSCYLLNAVSTHLCADVTPLPMLWCLLLALYLLSYIVSFTDRGAAWARYAAAAVVPLCLFGLYHLGDKRYEGYPVELAVGCAVLFIGGWIVHSRLYRLRPAAEGLTRYYCLIALGGAAGGATCSFVMPFVSTIVAEYPISLALVLGVVYLDWEKGIERLATAAGGQGRPPLPLRKIAGGVVAVVAVYGLVNGATAPEGFALKRFRNFYGTGTIVHVAVRDIFGSAAFEINRFMFHNTVHGEQVAQGDWKSLEPTTYYTERAGGQAIVRHPKFAAKESMRVGFLGMGVGTMAAYARQGDFYRFYEINPAVAAVAKDTRFFSFLDKASGKVEVVIDDARRGLERERSADEEKYDVLVVDVFSGDSIPSHMATKEAFRLYLDRLAEDGILAFHLSNWHLDLRPMIKAQAEALGIGYKVFVCGESRHASNALWAFLSRKDIPIEAERGVRQLFKPDEIRDIAAMSDDFHTLLPYLDFSKGGALK